MGLDNHHQINHIYWMKFQNVVDLLYHHNILRIKKNKERGLKFLIFNKLV